MKGLKTTGQRSNADRRRNNDRPRHQGLCGVSNSRVTTSGSHRRSHTALPHSGLPMQIRPIHGNSRERDEGVGAELPTSKLSQPSANTGLFPSIYLCAPTHPHEEMTPAAMYDPIRTVVSLVTTSLLPPNFNTRRCCRRLLVCSQQVNSV